MTGTTEGGRKAMQNRDQDELNRARSKGGQHSHDTDRGDNSRTQSEQGNQRGSGRKEEDEHTRHARDERSGQQNRNDQRSRGED